MFATRLNAFGGRLWTALHRDGGNQAIAPMSVGICLSMLIDGSNEPTRAQLIKTLGFDGVDVNRGALGLSQSLAQIPGSPFTISNGVWLHSKSRLNPAYAKSLRANFSGEIRRFTSADAATLKEINDWVRTHTKNRIPSIFEQLDPDTSVVLVNALTFDGKWQTPFKKTATQAGDFRLPSGSKASVPMMHQPTHLRVDQFPDFWTAALPYAGDRFEMRFLLPTAGHTPSQALRKWLANPNANAPDTAQANSISLPKFKIECSYDLKPSLGQMGLGPLYQDAKFGLISPDLARLTKIDQIQHKTYLKVNEEGTEAAASTGIAVVTRAILMKTIAFDLNRPFAYAIVDRTSGVIVMMGTVADPRG